MIKLGVIYGGKSTEHEVSIKSAKSILENLNKEKYEIYPIFINKDGTWHEEKLSIGTGSFSKENENFRKRTGPNRKKIENIIGYIKNLDIVFLVLHGLYGEDGTIQGMLELIGVKYVGCKVLASSVGMDKAYTKLVFEKAKINQAKYIYAKKYENKYIYVDDDLNEIELNIDELINKIEQKLKYPMFIKPSNSGSSVGVNKAKNRQELIKNIEIAAEFDDKILIEEGIIGKEVECAVIGNSKIGVEASPVGEILSAEDFYTFDAKYENQDSKTVIPAAITESQSEEIRSLAVKAFKAIDGSGLSRVDFFVENETGKIYINEINTMPGFTNISMYPKLFETYGYNYGELLDKIIEIDL